MGAKNIVLSFLLIVIFFIIGGALGFYLRGGAQVVPLPEDMNNTSELIKNLNSKVIPSIAAYGTVIDIDNRNLTLNYQGDSIVLPVREDARVHSFVVNKPAGGAGNNSVTTSSKQVEFSEIKVGDNISANIKILTNGQIEAFSVVILPQVANETSN